MRVTFAGERRPALRAAAAAAGACADARAGRPASTAPTTPLNDFAKPLRSSAISTSLEINRPQGPGLRPQQLLPEAFPSPEALGLSPEAWSYYGSAYASSSAPS